MTDRTIIRYQCPNPDCDQPSGEMLHTVPAKCADCLHPIVDTIRELAEHIFDQALEAMGDETDRAQMAEGRADLVPRIVRILEAGEPAEQVTERVKGIFAHLSGTGGVVA